MSHDRSPQLELAFQKWLSLQDIQIRQALVFEPADQASRFTLRHGAIELEGLINDRGIDILIERDGEYWGELLSLVVVPAATPDGYHCLACIESWRRTFSDIEHLWRDHLFGPLRGWMRRKIFRADRMGFYAAPGAKWVRPLRLGGDAGVADTLIDV